MKRSHTFFACLLFCALPFSASAQNLEAPDPVLAARLVVLEKSVEAKRIETHAPGAGLVIIKDDKIVYLKGFGYRDIETKEPVTAETLFAIGSSTKAFTALTMLMSQEDGKLKLTDSPRKYLPYFALQDPDANAKITLSDLLCHRSGLPRTDLFCLSNQFNSKAVIQNLVHCQPTAKFGEKFQYQNEMFLVAGEVVATAQKQAWEIFLRKRVLDPLGMKQTTLSVTTMAQRPDHATGYQSVGTPKTDYKMPYHNDQCVAPAGAINSNLKEMAQWVRFLLNSGTVNGKRMVSETGFQEIVSPHMTISGTVKYGYGWFLRDWQGHKVVEHGGNVDGFTAEVALMPDQHLGFVMLCNQNGSPLPVSAQDMVWKHLVDTSEPEAKPEAAIIPSVKPEEEVGNYAAGTFTFAITQQDGKLTATTPGQSPYPLVPVGGRKYKLTNIADGFFMTFRPNAKDSKILEAFLEQPQGNVVLTKKAPYHALLTVDELQRKVIAALGGEAALRKHTTQIIRAKTLIASDGMSGKVTFYAKAPNALTEDWHLFAMKKPVEQVWDWCDGKTADEENNIMPVLRKSGKVLVNRLLDSEFYEPLNWKTLYKSVVIKGEEKVGDEPVYVVVKTPEGGDPRIEYISTKTFLMLKRDSTPYEGNGINQPEFEIFLDYRQVDGVFVSFARIRHYAGADVHTFVEKVEWNPNLDDNVFKAKR